MAKAKQRFPKLDFGEVTYNLAKMTLRNDEFFHEVRKCLGLTTKQFEFYLENVVGIRKVEEDKSDEAKSCSYCGSGLILNGECQKCGL